MDILPKELYPEILRHLPRNEQLRFRRLNSTLAKTMMNNRTFFPHLRPKFDISVPYAVTKDGKNISDAIEMRINYTVYRIQFSHQIHVKDNFGNNLSTEFILIPEDGRSPPNCYYHFFSRLFSVIDVENFSMGSSLFEPVEEQLCRALKDVDCCFNNIDIPGSLKARKTLLHVAANAKYVTHLTVHSTTKSADQIFDPNTIARFSEVIQWLKDWCHFNNVINSIVKSWLDNPKMLMRTMMQFTVNRKSYDAGIILDTEIENKITLNVDCSRFRPNEIAQKFKSWSDLLRNHNDISVTRTSSKGNLMKIKADFGPRRRSYCNISLFAV